MYIAFEEDDHTRQDYFDSTELKQQLATTTVHCLDCDAPAMDSCIRWHTTREGEIVIDSREKMRRDQQRLDAYPALVEALRAVLATAVCNDDMSVSYAIDRKVVKQIRAALALAEGKE